MPQETELDSDIFAKYSHQLFGSANVTSLLVTPPLSATPFRMTYLGSCRPLTNARGWPRRYDVPMRDRSKRGKRMESQDFSEVWLVSFEFTRPPGEPPEPSRIWAREIHSCRAVQTDNLSEPPYSSGPHSLFVAFDAPAQLGCHLKLGWPLPAKIIDLKAEFRCLTSGMEIPGEFDLSDALAYFASIDLESLFAAMLPKLSLKHALLRGRYTAAVARMEAVGVPIDVEGLARLQEGWERLVERLIRDVDERYGVFDGRQFRRRRWRAWLNTHRISWPRNDDGELEIDQATFKDMAIAHPSIRPMKELRATLAKLRPSKISVGRDGRNRCDLRPFAAKTSRNAPRTSNFIFGPASWIRGLIKPAVGMALAYIDYELQEFGIAAGLSGDTNMIEEYKAGDPYLSFAKRAGAVPMHATKSSHRDDRKRFKSCLIGIQYGMGVYSLAQRLNVPRREAKRLLALHKATFPTYWRWSRAVVNTAIRDCRLQSTLGWKINVGPKPNRRSLQNFPIQANGAEMLRVSCCYLTEAGIRVCAPVHDALLVEAGVEDIDEVAARCQTEMRKASELVLRGSGLSLRTETKIIRWPNRFSEQEMWKKVFAIID